MLGEWGRGLPEACVTVVTAHQSAWEGLDMRDDKAMVLIPNHPQREKLMLPFGLSARVARTGR